MRSLVITVYEIFTVKSSNNKKSFQILHALAAVAHALMALEYTIEYAVSL